MSMTYKELMDLLNQETGCELCHHLVGDDCSGHHCRDVYKEVASIARDTGWNEGYDAGHAAGYGLGHEDAAQDYATWWVPDKNGERVHIKDKFQDNRCATMVVTGFCFDEDKPKIIPLRLELPGYNVNQCEKVIPDTKEKIIDDLADAFGDKGDIGYHVEARQFYERIAAQIKNECDA